MTIWNVFKNQYWPADYVADRTGEHPLHALRRRRLHRHRERDPQAARRPERLVAAGRHQVTDAETAQARTAIPRRTSGCNTRTGEPLIEIQAGDHDYTAPAAGSVARAAT